MLKNGPPVEDGGIEVLDNSADQEAGGGGQDEQEGSEQQQTDPEAEKAVQSAMLSIALSSLSNVATKVTGCDDVALSSDEIEHLKKLWEPIMPSMSPMTAALIGTGIIVVGKVAIYARFRAEQRTKDELGIPTDQRSTVPKTNIGPASRSESDVEDGIASQQPVQVNRHQPKDS